MVPIEETVRNPCARKKTQRSEDSDDKKSHSVHGGSCPKDLRQPAVSCRCHANGDEWQQMVMNLRREGESELAPFDQNLLIPLDLSRLRQIVIKLVSRLLTEGLLVRI